MMNFELQAFNLQATHELGGDVLAADTLPRASTAAGQSPAEREMWWEKSCLLAGRAEQGCSWDC